MASIPPCVLASPTRGNSTTFVAKVNRSGMLTDFGGAALANGASAYDIETVDDNIHFVIKGKEHKIKACQGRLEKDLPALGMDAEWVRPLTCRLQGLLR